MPAWMLAIKGRLYGGFGGLVLLALALACFGIWQFSEIAARVERMGSKSQKFNRSDIADAARGYSRAR